MNRELGGVLVMFGGVVLLIMGVRGTLRNTWYALTHDPGSTAPGQVVPPTTSGASSARPTDASGRPIGQGLADVQPPSPGTPGTPQVTV